MTEQYMKEFDRKHTPTVGEVIEFLKSHFKPTDKLCYMDCIEGVKYNAEPIYKEDLGKRFFRYAKDYMTNDDRFKNETFELVFPYIEPNDVIII